MLTVKCTQCQAGMKLQKAPAGGKVKCPRCGAVVPVRQPAATKSAAAGSLTPDDDDFDFGQINFPSAAPAAAVSSFPVNPTATAYQGPIPGDPLADQTQADGNPPSDVPAAAAANNAAGKGKPLPVKIIAGVVSGLVAFVVMFFVVSMMFGGGDGDANATAANASAQLSKNVPAGYQVVEFEGCAVYMPEGEVYREMPPGAMESKVIESAKTGSIFFFGAMYNGKMELDKEQMRKKAMRFVAGDVLGGSPTERNGYQGIKGRVSVSAMLPDMTIEAYLVDERYILIGSLPASMGADVETQMSIDRAAENEEQTIFFDSLTVGAKSGGLFF
ncbi:hypothetical protein [Novipirellula caenicola]|uniref:Zinc finger/thioredoxin putative domain-containing protein n=1 Tax=Novipirellula caenicola TaxID=1536901 RepID=A0ABP9VRK7_9BACT